MNLPTFYIASSRDRLTEVRQIARLLTEAGMASAFPWPDHFEHRCSSDTCGIFDRPDLARRELKAASTCDLFIGITRMGKGSHVELGAALTSRERSPKRVILVGVDRADLVFYDADDIEYAQDVVELIAMLERGVPWRPASKQTDADLAIAEMLEWA